MQERKRLEIQQLEPIISEERLFNMRNVILAFLFGIISIIILIVTIQYFDLNFTDSLLASVLVIVTYAIILFFLLEPKVLRKVHTREIETIEKPIIRTIEKPVFREVIKEIEKPVFKEVVKRVFVEKPRKTLNIPRYRYRGSTQSKTYHKTSCRLSKLIKRKYKISKNDTAYFQRRGFKPCKICMPHKKLKKK